MFVSTNRTGVNLVAPQSVSCPEAPDLVLDPTLLLFESIELGATA